MLGFGIESWRYSFCFIVGFFMSMLGFLGGWGFIFRWGWFVLIRVVSFVCFKVLERLLSFFRESFYDKCWEVFFLRSSVLFGRGRCEFGSLNFVLFCFYLLLVFWTGFVSLFVRFFWSFLIFCLFAVFCIFGVFRVVCWK